MAAQTQATVAKLKVQDRSTGVGQSLTRLALRRLRRDNLTLIALFIVILLAFMSFIGAPIIDNVLNVSMTDTHLDRTFAPLFSTGVNRDGTVSTNVLGTDDLGRDHFSRLLYAGRISLSVGFCAAMIALGIGVALGITTGYYGGIVDDITNWIIATLTSIPALFLLLIVAAVLPSAGPVTLILVLGFLGWTGTTRLVRGETLALREREYVISARAVGASPGRIMFTHILPNLFSIIVITLAIDIGGLILAEAALSYLGLGIKPPDASWGNMLTGAQGFFNKGIHLVIFPGLLIFITVLCLYLIGDGLRDAFDPTAKN